MGIRELRHWCALALSGLTLAFGSAIASEVQIRILDRDGEPVPEVAVFARVVGESFEAGAGQAAASWSVGQHDLIFDPYFSIVRTGTEIRFSNDDDVRHHVYSFSDVRRFDFTIDSGTVDGESLSFDKAGVVTLGCNIHDDMLAYILVVDTPHYAMTNADGLATLETGPGRFELSIWTPRLSSRNLPEPEIFDVGADAPLELIRHFEAKLYPAHEHSATSLLWSSY